MRPNPDVALPLLALVGILLLFTLGEVLEPPSIALADVAAHEGERVQVLGRVLDVRAGERGRFFSIAHDAHRLDALAGPGDGPARGDVLRAVGIIARGDRALVLSVERYDTVERAGERPVSPVELARAPADYDGARVLVRGEATRGALRAEGASVALGGVPPPEEGWWLAAGEFGYRARDASYVLWVDTWTPAP